MLLSCDIYIPDSKIDGANMGPTWVLAAPDGPHVGPMNLAIRVVISSAERVSYFNETAEFQNLI